MSSKLSIKAHGVDCRESQELMCTVFQPAEQPETDQAAITPGRRQLYSSHDHISCPCLLVLGPIVPESVSQVWVAEQHSPSRGVLRVHHPPKADAECIDMHACVTCMEASPSGRVWIGHQDGSVSVRSGDRCSRVICPPFIAFDCPVKAIALDLNGAAWAVSQAGKVCILDIKYLRRQARAAAQELVKRQQLVLSLPGSADAEAEALQDSQVAVIQMYNFGCWTAGATGVKCHIVEWSLKGECRAIQEVTDAGLPTAMTRLMPDTGPCRTLGYLEPLRLWYAAYDNGNVRVQPIAALGDLDACPDGTRSFMRLQAHTEGLTAADGGDEYLATAGSGGTVSVFSMADVTSAGQAEVQPVPEDSLLASTANLPVDIQEKLRALSPAILEKFITDSNAHSAIQAVQSSIDRQREPLRGWLDENTGPNANGHLEAATGGQVSHADVLALLKLLNPFSAALSPLPVSPEGNTPEDRGQTPFGRTPSSEKEAHDLTSEQSSEPLAGFHRTSSDKECKRKSSGSVDIFLGEFGSDMAGRQMSEEVMELGYSRSFTAGGHMKWLITMEQLTIQKKVAQGSIGAVYLARYQETDVAVKALRGLEDLQRIVSMAPDGTRSNPTALNSWLANSGVLQDSESLSTLQSLEREVDILASIRHPNVVLFMGMVLDPPLIVSEWCARGSVYDILSKAAQNPRLAAQLTWHRRLCMALDAAKGVYQLHKHDPQIIHADLKSPNLVCDGNWRVKVTDFNLSRVVGDREYPASQVANNPRWQAPEVIASHKMTERSDVFSFGVVLWELITMQLPWDNMNPFQIMRALTEGERLDLPDPTPVEAAAGEGPIVKGLTDLIAKCWAHDPAARPTFPTIIASLRSLLEACKTLHGLPLSKSRSDRPRQIPLTATPPLASAGQQAVKFHTFARPRPTTATVVQKSPFATSPQPAVANS
ncbi:hypothetical protein WJX73_004122 [Symbiochloris irregularis]|uniref:Protein kinase domain-containing protein n=1 Tax=Symbiochloris irregularis TaxID=706552 RepID=A0AAW1PQS3_9CHLO